MEPNFSLRFAIGEEGIDVTRLVRWIEFNGGFIKQLQSVRGSKGATRLVSIYYFFPADKELPYLEDPAEDEEKLKEFQCQFEKPKRKSKIYERIRA